MRLTSYLLILLPILWIGFRVLSDETTNPGLISEKQYQVTYKFEAAASGDSLSFRAYLPPETVRQDIELDTTHLIEKNIRIHSTAENQFLIYGGIFDNNTTMSISFSVKTRAIEYVIDENLQIGDIEQSEQELYLQTGSVVQPIHPDILLLADELRQSSPDAVLDLSRTLYRYVKELPASSQNTHMDAHECLQAQICSGTGKSNLLIALFLANNIPSKMAGGIILEEGTSKRSHNWTEAYIQDSWIPFDTLNDNFAKLPSNYLKIYNGNQNIANNQSNDTLDFQYQVSEDRDNSYPDYAFLNIWKLVDSNIVPLEPLLVLLLLPLGAYLVAVFKNVVGLDTYGVFLPVLIAFALMDMGVIQGLIFFSVIIGLIGLLSIPLTRWEILHTPKIVILLTAVAIFSLLSIQTFYQTGWVNPSATLTFPMIILTIISENFARKIEEETLKEALFIYGQTLIVTLTCTWILSSDLLQNFFITFPEALLIVAGMSLLLGKWIGLRLIEYKRFANIDEEVSNV